MKYTTTITREDLIEAIYFIWNKFTLDPTSRISTFSGRSRKDLFGGFTDRWINNFMHDWFFNQLFVGKEYEIIRDRYLYSNNKLKNAADLLGLKSKKSVKNVPFYTLREKGWERISSEYPYIEVKTFKSNDNLVTLPFDIKNDDFYILLDARLDEDFLIHLFPKEWFEYKHNYSKDYGFNGKNILNSDLKMPKTPQKQSVIGQIELIKTITGKDIKDKFLKVGIGEQPYYWKSADIKIVNLKSNGKPNWVCSTPKESFVNISKTKTEFTLQSNFPRVDLFIPGSIELVDDIQICQCQKSVTSKVHIYNSNPANRFLGQSFDAEYISMNASQFLRTSQDKEYVCDKSIATNVFSDRTEDLLYKLDEIWGD